MWVSSFLEKLYSFNQIYHMGPSINYVGKILPIFDPPPPSEGEIYYISLCNSIGIWLTPLSCLRSLWIVPNYWRWLSASSLSINTWLRPTFLMATTCTFLMAAYHEKWITAKMMKPHKGGSCSAGAEPDWFFKGGQFVRTTRLEIVGHVTMWWYVRLGVRIMV